MKMVIKRIGCFLLTLILVLSLAAGHGSGQEKNLAFAGTSKKITVKAASDFSLKFPASWKNQYVMKASKDKKHGSYVAFYAKKCYQQTKEGWLFSIMRFVDDSYVDMPDYELVGKWNGYYYVALFPTDVQTVGATKAAKKQYSKLVKGARNAAASIRPVKKERKGEQAFPSLGFSLKLPSGWKGNYVVEESDTCVAFYEKECYEQSKDGWLFSVVKFEDDSWPEELPRGELAGKWNGCYYVVSVPRVMPLEGVSEDAAKQYWKLAKTVEKAVDSIQPY